MPWCSDGPDEAELGGALDTTCSDWADRTHAQGGTVVVGALPQPQRRTRRPRRHRPRRRGRDARPESDDALLEYYRYLNTGYRLPLVGGTDKMSNGVPVGLYRTYAQLGRRRGAHLRRLVPRGPLAAARFLSGGPLLTLHRRRTASPATPSSCPARAPSPSTPSVTSIFPLRIARARLQRRGRRSRRTRRRRQARSHPQPSDVRIDGSTWIAARAFGTRQPPRRMGPAGLRPHVAGLRRLRRTVGHGRPGRTPLHPHARHTAPATTSATPQSAATTPSPPTTTANPTTSPGSNAPSPKHSEHSTTGSEVRRVTPEGFPPYDLIGV